MKKRRVQILSMALAVGMVVSNVSPAIPVMAAGNDVETDVTNDIQMSVSENPETESGQTEDTSATESNTETEEAASSEDAQTQTEEAVPTESNTESESNTQTEEVTSSEDAQTESDKIVETESELSTQALDTEKKKAASNDYHGLEAEYYSTKGSGTEVAFDQLISHSIDFDIKYGDMDAKLKEQTGQADAAGVKWTGRIMVPETGNYTFYGLADNGLRLWINDEQLLSHWDGSSWDKLQTSGQVYLEAGKYYSFQCDYFDFEGGSHITLSWKNDQSIAEKTTVPGSALYLPEDYDSLYIDSYDAGSANLVEDDSFDGHITVDGSGFSDDTTFEIVKATGSSLATPVYPEVLSRTDNKISMNIPKLTAGTYKIKAVEGNTNVVSNSMVIVQPSATTGQTRPERPRADWERTDYVNINGWWDFAFDPNEEGQKNGWYESDKKLDRVINVPFCWESPLSGVEDPNYMGQAWYQKKISVDPNWDGRKIFIKFGAVDWKCKLWVNGEEVGEHVGGYNAFEFDITDYVKAGEVSTITLWVEDKGSYGDDTYPALIGKQGRNAPCGYIHTSGIWQTVGLEARSATFLDNARAATDVDNSTVTYTMDVDSDIAQELIVEYDFASKVYDVAKDEDIPTGSVMQGSQVIQAEKGKSSVTLDAITVQNPKLWNYDDPNLYYGTLTVKDKDGNVLDTVDTYFGMRKVEQKFFDESLGVKYMYINNKPVYMSGLLDQGFWEDGIYTAPSEDALKYDILQMKEAGFNMIRKHLKVEDPLQYYWCDKLGMMVWQDMPHATAMVPDQNGDATPGREYFEQCLDSMMNMNYNHPSIVAVMLFNETWGLQKAYFDGKRDLVAADGKSTKVWVEELFNRTKALNPNLLVEDMSACNGDHVQPTEMNTYHMYPDSYQATVDTVERWNNSAFVGSTDNFKFGEVQDGDVFMNSEYGGVGAGSGDFDVSYCFKYMTDIQRRYEKQSGFVYTEPYDVEYERNGIMTYDRDMKVFGYDEIAYGGDMGIKDLTQEIYIGVVDQPIRNVTAGKKMKTQVMTMGWTDKLPETVVMKWRFDGTDIYGNSISTDQAGEKTLNMNPYRKLTTTITYNAPTQACVGTLTVWLEDTNGSKLAKNFTNVVVADDTTKNVDYTQKNEDGSLVMKAKVSDEKMASTKATGAQTYSYTVPADFDISSLNGMRVLAEASSCKTQIGSDKFLSSFSSDWGQTAEGRERSSDLTVSVNGVEVDTVFLSDNPRDMRGTLSLNSPYNGKTSAGNFGYLVNLNISDEKLEAIKAAMGDSKNITVTYEVKADAQNQNGLRIYTASYGRYAVNPTLVLNPTDKTIDGIVNKQQVVDTDGDNYSVEAGLENKESYVVRTDNNGGYQVQVSDDGTSVTLVNVKTGDLIASAELNANGAAHEVKTTVFDEQIRVYLDNDPEPAINVYDKSGFTGDVMVNVGAEDVTVAPESYSAVKADVSDKPVDANYTDDFSDTNLDGRYEKMGKDIRAEVKDGALSFTARTGDKLINNDIWMADGIYEADITLNSLNEKNGNTGITFRSTNYLVGADGLDGYYAGLGNGYVQLGRMNNNWKELANVSVPSLTMNTTHRLKVAVFGSRIQVYVDDVKTPYVDVVDNTYSEGGASIRGFQSASTIDNVKIVSIPSYTSDFAHGTGEFDANGTWKSVEGVYTVTGKGTALITGSEQKDLTLSADLKAAEEAALPAILFRAKEGAAGLDGYRVVLNVKADKIQLVKTVKGVDTVLKERSWKLDTDRSYHVSVEAAGSSIKVYLDNEQKAMFAVTDSEFEKGLTGLGNGSAKAAFDNLAINGNFVNGDLLPEASQTALNKLKDDAAKLDKNKYTEKSFARVTQALEKVKEINIWDQKEIDTAAQAIQDAFDLLIEKGSSGSTDEALEEAIKKAELAQKAAEEAKKAAEAAKTEAEKLQSEAAAAKAAAEAAQKKAEEMAEASKAEKEAAEKAAKEAAEAAADAEKKAEAAVAAVNAAKAAQKAAEDALNKTKQEINAVRIQLKAAQDEVAKAKAEAEKARAEAEKARAEAVAAAKRAQEAADALQKELKRQEEEKNRVKKGDVVSDGKLKYKVTSTSSKTISVYRIAKSSLTSITIPSYVKIKGVNYKVTAITGSAFKNNKKLTKVTIGKYVAAIGGSAFYNNTKLKSVIVKTNVLKSVGTNSFKGIYKKAYINVPNAKAKTYKKLFSKAGQVKTVKIK